MIKIIGISGVARSGKDSLYDILQDIFIKQNINCDRIALADPLKTELNSFTMSNYNISAFTKDPKEKEIIRPLMVVHGKIKRGQTNGKYFTNIAQKRINENLTENILSIITDIRYSYYSEDEVSWLRKNNGILVHIERINLDGSLIGPINQDEADNNIKIKELSDYKLVWPTTNDKIFREDCVNIQLKELIERIKNERN